MYSLPRPWSVSRSPERIAARLRDEKCRDYKGIVFRWILETGVKTAVTSRVKERVVFWEFLSRIAETMRGRNGERFGQLAREHDVVAQSGSPSSAIRSPEPRRRCPTSPTPCTLRPVYPSTSDRCVVVRMHLHHPLMAFLSQSY